MKIYIVFKNADFTEGRGPMLFHFAFTNGADAVKYVEAQGGIYGSPQKVTMNYLDHYAYGNGYKIDEVDVHNSLDGMLMEEYREAKAKALKKLTTEEQRLLGLI